jgi:AcrR family transcriptional regulator
MTATPARTVESPAATAAGTAPIRAPRTGTRARALDVALELFVRHGYEQTSLREIADRLGVTKAALYYHFRSKEELVSGLVESVAAPIDEAVAWAAGRPCDARLRAELLRRLSAGMADQGRALLRFFHENQSVVRELDLAPQFKQRMTRLVELLHGPDPAFEDRIRSSMALMAVNAGHLLCPDAEEEAEGAEEVEEAATGQAERNRAGLAVALEIAGHIGSRRPAGVDLADPRSGS